MISQFDKFVNVTTREILGANIERENLVPMLSTDIPAKLVELIITQNGTYYPDPGIDGFYKVIANIQSKLQPLTVTENGTYLPPSGYDGFNSVIVSTKQGLNSPGFKNMSLECKPTGNNLTATLIKLNTYVSSDGWPSSLPTISNTDFLNAAKSDSFYSCVLESYMTSNYITLFGAELLGDFHSGGETTGNVLTHPITNYSVIILQGIYKTQTDSNYNRSDFYGSIDLNTSYVAGMINRNSSYNCGITFTDSTHCNLSGNKQCMIYGII